MLIVHGKPLLEYILNGLIYSGFKDVILVVGYKKEQIMTYFKDGKKWNINLEYIEQEKLNGTGGALLACENAIENKQFFLSWGDILVPYSIYKDVIKIFQQEDQKFILVTNYAKDPHKGAAVYVKNNYLVNIIEKPPIGKSKSILNNCGIFIFPIEIFKILHELKPSKRGEIELTDAIRIGIKKKHWKIRVVKLKKNQFRGDFGDKTTYEHLSENSSWLSKLINDEKEIG
jgi:glucose-1-phosphate thymidylyltransferase